MSIPNNAMESDLGHNPALIWCPLIPLDDLSGLTGHESELEKINQVYDDWRSSMRGRSTTVDDVGIFLDRIRILWINVGVACGAERVLAEKVQTIVRTQLRKGALTLVSRMPNETSEESAVKQTLTSFFEQLRFGHDIFPLEEIQEVAVPLRRSRKSSDSSSHETERESKQEKKHQSAQKHTPSDGVVNAALAESLRILSELFAHLLSPDPWGVE
jgi:hypothetical protein